MLKKYKYFIVFLAGFLFLANFSYCLALEVQTYPNIPFAPTITQNSKLPDFIVYFFAAGIYLAGALAVLSLAYHGIKLMLSLGDPTKISDAKKGIISSLLGLILIMSSVVIIRTINPALENVDTTVKLEQSGAIILEGTNNGTPITTPAPLAVQDLGKLIIGGWSNIYWPAQVSDLKGGTKPNCNPSDPGYLIYFYQEKNFKNARAYIILKCGQRIGLAGNYSYIMEKLTPGVYLFTRANDCGPAQGSNDIPPAPHDKSIPKLNVERSWTSPGMITSVMVVNGDNPLTGPFFGAVIFNMEYYKGTIFIHIPFSETANSVTCYSASFRMDTSKWCAPSFGLYCPQIPASVAIYKWVGKDKDGGILSAGPGVTLYSKPERQGGRYTFNTQTMGAGFKFWKKPLKGVWINYAEARDITEEEQNICRYFMTPPDTSGWNKYIQDIVSIIGGYDDLNHINHYCLNSLKIDGNYLVLLSSQEDKFLQVTGNKYLNFVGLIGQAEVFPKENDPLGPYDLNLTFVNGGTWCDINKMFCPQYIEIIPLSEPIY